MHMAWAPHGCVRHALMSVACELYALNTTYELVQLSMPSPSYPSLQEHVRFSDGAARSVHVAWVWHVCVRHVLMSEECELWLLCSAFIPLQVSPSPSYPSLHAQVRFKEGGAVSMHVAWAWHGCVRHVLMSLR